MSVNKKGGGGGEEERVQSIRVGEAEEIIEERWGRVAEAVKEGRRRILPSACCDLAQMTEKEWEGGG